MKTINKIATITALLLTFGLAGCTKEDSTNKYLPKNAQPGEGVVSEKINNEYKPLEQIELGGKQSSKFEYDDKGNLLNKYTADWKEQTFIRFEYDKQGNPIKTVKTDCKTGVQTITANGQEKKYMNVPDVGWVEVVEEIWRGEKEYHEVRDFEVSYQMGRPYFKEFDVENIEELTEKFNKSLNLKENKDIFIDFNSIAKGYSVDLIGEFLSQKQINNYLIEVGGEILAKGINKRTKSIWTLGIQDPLNQDKYIQTVELNNKAMATSGNYRKYRLDPETGERYVHTINPITGLTSKNNTLSVSVISKDCTTSDAWATALLSLDLNRGRAIIDQKESLEALWILSDKDKVEIIKSKNWDKLSN